jgi:hypothetical protein
MVDQITLEQKRAEAKTHKGVFYDSRIDRFIASITINGERRHLGSFADAGDAATAYDTARDAHPLFRAPRHWAKTVRQQMIAFGETAQREEGKRNLILPGQIFEMVGGQRFRIERSEIRKGNTWYIWSSRCYFCGALFEQFTTTQLRKVTGLTRSCHDHRNQNRRAEGLPQNWPDPEGWDGVARVEPARVIKKADAATLRMHETQKDNVFAYLRDKPEMQAEFYRIENEIEFPFRAKYREDNPGAGSYDWLLEWNKRPDPYKALRPPSTINSVVMSPADHLQKITNDIVQPMTARIEDMMIAAEEPEQDNSDLA